ncbi:type II secretion system minor pseudopilin GspK [Acinetobacter shaoyimingii]|uniref:Type II secretion system protein K n=1 Tax=Acinetobacter shaoyimingii TaxID=2715164 RepID=A0A6G8S008_9GAMM|nr:type II secretion system minor pseudopilin GspK [Acinetobacter shaoyimingii]NHB57218.1 type II secretion system minor pseudopilin GspK [Acinetobacter shaoyimingii]QIO07487.1 type II secretion system minor pseudopilin GspK [Acinetobacter shaoyimingii]
MGQQRGIALITILVMVALATILAASIAKHQQFTSENTAYLMRQNQSLLYAKSAEAFYTELLAEDARSNSNADYLQESWAKPLPPFPIEGGVVAGKLEDETGKFNLNSLLKEDGTPEPEAQAYFERLLKRVGLPAGLSEAVIDWQDPDDLTIGAAGAESNYYQGLRSSYMAANAPFLSAEELKQVRGFEGKNYELIAPYVTAIPKQGMKININTAPALVLAALDDKLDVNQIQNMIEQRQANMEYFSNVSDLWNVAPFDQISTESRAKVETLLDVKSSLFKIQVLVKLHDRQRQFSSYLMREDKNVYTYARSLAPFNSFN